MTDIFKPRKSAPINKSLAELKEIRSKLDRLEEQAETKKKQIRDGFTDVVIAFVDMVGSTARKMKHSKDPETWIFQLDQFGELITEYVNELGGTVVKYIGDEIMAVFNRESTMVNDAFSLVFRVNEIQTNLERLIKEPIQIKIAVDMGSVYMVHYEGHDQPDPQGTAVDRCARIAKLVEPGTVLSSHEFVQHSTELARWSELGTIDLKGIGETTIYQLGSETVKLRDTITLDKDEYNEFKNESRHLRNQNQELTVVVKDLETKNYHLQGQIEALGAEPSPENSIREENDISEADEAWSKIQDKIGELKTIIRDSGADCNEYARFLFLDFRGEGQKYNAFERAFDSCRQTNLVKEEGDGFYILDSENKRNKKALKIMGEIEARLEQYGAEYSQEDDLLEYTITSMASWEEFMPFSVR